MTNTKTTAPEKAQPKQQAKQARPAKVHKESAGGWGALTSVARSLLHSGNPAKTTLTLRGVNQPHGFDCPGCAWGDPEHASSFEFCENGVKAVAWEATSKTVGPTFFAEHSVEWLKRQDHHYLEAQGRLAQPMRYERTLDRYVPVSWEDAFRLIGETLRGLDDPNEALFYTSGRTSNEAAFLYQLFVRAYGTNNFPDCSNMCHEASGIAMSEQIGTGKGTVLLEDFEKAEAIFVWGQNPGTNHPRMLGALREAALRGCKIVVFNPVRERGLEKFADPKHVKDMLPGGGVDIASHYCQVRVGGDMAAAKGLLKILFEKYQGRLDQAFIQQHTEGFERLMRDAEATSWEEIEAQSGLTREQLEVPAEIYATSNATIFTWAMGLTQHRHSVVTIQTLVDVLLLKGNVGKPGAGPCPVRGHSNVQGDRTMGITEHPSDHFLDRLEATFPITAPRAPGYGTVHAIQAMLAGKAKVFIGMGGNFAAATPDTQMTEQALANCKLTVHISTKLNRSHLITGEQALILPCLGRTEIDLQNGVPQMVTVEDSMSMVHGSGGINRPVSPHLLSEPAIVAGMAKATLPDVKIDWDSYVADYSRIRSAIARVIPGFEGYNEKVAKPGGFHLRNPAREREWNTAQKKARFMANPLPPLEFAGPVPVAPVDAETATAPVADGTAGGPADRPIDGRVFTLMSFRSHDQYNTTIYGYDDRYRGIYGYRRVLFMNREDMEAEGLAVGDVVDIRTAIDDGVKRVAEGFRIVGYDIPRGQVASYYPETNVLVPLWSYGERSMTPTSKSIPVLIEKRETAAA